jgi:hypothetical protein
MKTIGSKGLPQITKKEGVKMKKFIFITPEGLTFKPNCDHPEPDYMDIQIFSFDKKHSIEDSLSDLIELNQNVVGNNLDSPFSVRIEKENKKNLWLSDHKTMTSHAS